MIAVLAPMLWGFCLAAVLALPLACAWQRQRARAAQAVAERAAVWNLTRQMLTHPARAGGSVDRRAVRPACHRPRGLPAAALVLPVPLRRRMP